MGKRLSLLLVQLMAMSVALESAEAITVDKAADSMFLEHETSLRAITRVPGAGTVDWDSWMAAGAENVAVSRNGELFCLLSLRREPMVMAAHFDPPSHRWLIGMIVASSELRIDSARLRPGSYGLWLEGAGAGADSTSTRIVLRDGDDVATQIELTDGIELRRKNRYRVTAEDGEIAIRINDALVLLGG